MKGPFQIKAIFENESWKSSEQLFEKMSLMTILILRRWYLFVFAWIKLALKSVLCQELNFSVKPESIETSEILVYLQLFFGYEWQEDMCSQELGWVFYFTCFPLTI